MQRQNCEHLILSIFTGTQVIHRKLVFFFATDEKGMPKFVLQALIFLELLPWTLAYRNLKYQNSVNHATEKIDFHQQLNLIFTLISAT